MWSINKDDNRYKLKVTLSPTERLTKQRNNATNFMLEDKMTKQYLCVSPRVFILNPNFTIM